MLVVFGATVLPYVLWNYSNHGVFKATPLEGAGSYMHIGYWAGKTPGYTDRFYLQNFMGDELIRFTPEDSIPAHIKEYELEWAGFKEKVHIALPIPWSANDCCSKVPWSTIVRTLCMFSHTSRIRPSGYGSLASNGKISNKHQ